MNVQVCVGVTIGVWAGVRSRGTGHQSDGRGRSQESMGDGAAEGWLVQVSARERLVRSFAWEILATVHDNQHACSPAHSGPFSSLSSQACA